MTDQVTLHPLWCGSLTAPRSMFEAGGSAQPIEVPVPAWLIRHRDGLALFDAGMPASLTEPGPTRDAVELFFTVGCDPDDLVGRRLEQVDVDPGEIAIVIASHLHFDHVGGLAQLPAARLLVQRAEWDAVNDEELAAGANLDRDSALVGHDVETVSGEHDVFGDGTVVTIPTPGHTPGHQSLRVRTSEREVVLCGDCAYFETTLAGGPLPGFGFDLDAQARSRDHLASLRRRGTMVVPGHDPETFATLPERL